MAFPNHDDDSGFVYNSRLRCLYIVFSCLKKNWMPEEDELLKRLIGQYGATEEWSEIAEKV